MERNVGIDILKVIAMLLVVILFVTNGLISNFEPLTAKYYITSILNIIAAPALNIFALITGYLMVEKKFKLTKIIALWIEVAFYTILITLISLFFTKLSIKQLLSTLIPLISNKYWYFTAYFALFLLMPFINKFLTFLEKRQIKRFFLALFLLLSLFPCIAGSDLFNTNNGYSLIWITYLYMLGGYIKLYGVKLKFKLIIPICYIAIFIVFYLLGDKIPNLINPTMPLLFALSVCLFNAAIDSKIKNKKIEHLIPCIFGVYIILYNPILREPLYNLLVNITNLNNYVYTFVVIALSIATYIILLLIDYGRNYLFKLMQVNKFTEFIEKTIKRI